MYTFAALYDKCAHFSRYMFRKLPSGVIKVFIYATTLVIFILEFWMAEILVKGWMTGVRLQAKVGFFSIPILSDLLRYYPTF
jgi:hypothetical protein